MPGRIRGCGRRSRRGGFGRSAKVDPAALTLLVRPWPTGPCRQRSDRAIVTQGRRRLPGAAPLIRVRAGRAGQARHSACRQPGRGRRRAPHGRACAAVGHGAGRVALLALAEAECRTRIRKLLTCHRCPAGASAGRPAAARLPAAPDVLVQRRRHSQADVGRGRATVGAARSHLLGLAWVNPAERSPGHGENRAEGQPAPYRKLQYAACHHHRCKRCCCGCP